LLESSFKHGEEMERSLVLSREDVLFLLDVQDMPVSQVIGMSSFCVCVCVVWPISVGM